MKNDYLLPLIKDSGLYKIEEDGSVWTLKRKTHGVSTTWRRADFPSGTRGRPQVRYLGKTVYASRLVWYWHKGEIPLGCEIDHKDNNPSNNRLSNLQPLKRLENQQKAEAEGLLLKSRYPSDNRKKAIKEWWSQPETKSMMSEAAKRGWERRRRTSTS